MHLTEHFEQCEFELDGPMPDACVDTYRQLCVNLLEPLRVHYNEEIHVTSGYRGPASNNEAHGVHASQHIATSMYCAADWYIPSLYRDMRAPFDLIRSSAGLVFDQIILEHGSSGDIIHTSWSRAFNRREALEGATANQTAYKSWSTSPATDSPPQSGT